MPIDYYTSALKTHPYIKDQDRSGDDSDFGSDLSSFIANDGDVDYFNSDIEDTTKHQDDDELESKLQRKMTRKYSPAQSPKAHASNESLVLRLPSAVKQEFKETVTKPQVSRRVKQSNLKIEKNPANMEKLTKETKSELVLARNLRSSAVKDEMKQQCEEETSSKVSAKTNPALTRVLRSRSKVQHAPEQKATVSKKPYSTIFALSKAECVQINDSKEEKLKPKVMLSASGRPLRRAAANLAMKGSYAGMLQNGSSSGSASFEDDSLELVEGSSAKNSSDGNQDTLDEIKSSKGYSKEESTFENNHSHYESSLKKDSSDSSESLPQKNRTNLQKRGKMLSEKALPVSSNSFLDSSPERNAKNKPIEYLQKLPEKAFSVSSGSSSNLQPQKNRKKRFRKVEKESSEEAISIYSGSNSDSTPKKSAENNLRKSEEKILKNHLGSHPIKKSGKTFNENGKTVPKNKQSISSKPRTGFSPPRKKGRKILRKIGESSSKKRIPSSNLNPSKSNETRSKKPHCTLQSYAENGHDSGSEDENESEDFSDSNASLEYYSDISGRKAQSPRALFRQQQMEDEDAYESTTVQGKLLTPRGMFCLYIEYIARFIHRESGPQFAHNWAANPSSKDNMRLTKAKDLIEKDISVKRDSYLGSMAWSQEVLSEFQNHLILVEVPFRQWNAERCDLCHRPGNSCSVELRGPRYDAHSVWDSRRWDKVLPKGWKKPLARFDYFQMRNSEPLNMGSVCNFKISCYHTLYHYKTYLCMRIWGVLNKGITPDTIRKCETWCDEEWKRLQKLLKAAADGHIPKKFEIRDYLNGAPSNDELSSISSEDEVSQSSDDDF